MDTHRDGMMLLGHCPCCGSEVFLAEAARTTAWNCKHCDRAEADGRQRRGASVIDDSALDLIRRAVELARQGKVLAVAISVGADLAVKISVNNKGWITIGQEERRTPRR